MQANMGIDSDQCYIGQPTEHTYNISYGLFAVF